PRGPSPLCASLHLTFQLGPADENRFPLALALLLLDVGPMEGPDERRNEQHGVRCIEADSHVATLTYVGRSGAFHGAVERGFQRRVVRRVEAEGPLAGAAPLARLALAPTFFATALSPTTAPLAATLDDDAHVEPPDE